MTRFPEPHHIALRPEHLQANGGLGRPFFLPGSDARARRIAERLHGVSELPSPRQLNAYLGTLRSGGRSLEVGVLATGMGCPAMNIVVTELVGLGAHHLLRVGSAGSLQPHRLRVGDLVIATAAVRDEATSDALAPREFPAVAHPLWVSALSGAARRLGLAERVFAGVVHTKDALYGREFALGPLAERNRAYMETLRGLGVLASEMETAHLFVFAAAARPAPTPLSVSSRHEVLAGSLLAIIGDEGLFAPPERAREAEERAITLALEATLDLLLGPPGA